MQHDGAPAEAEHVAVRGFVINTARWGRRHRPRHRRVQCLFGRGEHRPWSRLGATDERRVGSPGHDGRWGPLRHGRGRADVVVVEVTEHDPFDVAGAPAELLKRAGDDRRAVRPPGIDDGDPVGAQPEVAVERVRHRRRDADAKQVIRQGLNIGIADHDA